MNIFKQGIGILKKLRNVGIVHRDVKPHNMTIDKQNKLYFIDFGLA